MESYLFIDQHKKIFGIRRLLQRLGIYPNAYYNYRKHRKKAYNNHKKIVLDEIKGIYHTHNGVDGYRQMTSYPAAQGYKYSFTTIHKYMNRELGLKSIVRPKKPKYKPSTQDKIFENKLNHHFIADEPNQK